MESTKSMSPESVAGTEVDWKTQIPVADRRRVVNALSDWMKKGVSAGPGDAPQIESIAIQFEGKIFSTATSKEDYRQKICLKLQQPGKQRPQQSIPSSSPPGPANAVESSIHQASLQPQCHGPGQPMEMQAGLLNRPPSVVMHSLPHQMHATHHQGTKLNQQISTMRQHQNKAKVPDLLSQHKLYGLNSHSGGNMQQLGRNVNASAFNEQPSNIGMQLDQGNIQRVPKIQLQPQAQQTQPPFLQTLESKTLKQQPNLQLMSQMHMQPQENNIRVMAEGKSQGIYSVGDDWKEELFKKITYLKDSYLPALMVKHGEIVQVFKKMSTIPQHQRPDDCERLQRLLNMHMKVYSFLNFPRAKMSEEVHKWLPHCKKMLYLLLQDRSVGHLPLPEQKQLSTSDALSLQQPVPSQSQTKKGMVTAQVGSIQLQQYQISQNVAHHGEQRGQQHHQQSVNLPAHHSSQFIQATSVGPVKGMGAETANILPKECVGNCSSSNHEPVNSEPVSTPAMNVSEKSSPFIRHCSSSTFSVDPASTPSFQSLMNENQCLVHNANNGISPSGSLAENANISVKQSFNSGSDLSESSLSEEPIQRLIKAARSMSPYAFNASVKGMESVLRMVDRTAGQVTVDGSKYAVDDLAGVTTCRYGSAQRNSYETPVPVGSFEPGTIDDGFNHLTDSEASQLESAIATNEKRQIIEARSMPSNIISACDRDMESVLSMFDTTTGQTAGNGPECAADLDLSAFATFCYGMKQEVSPQTTQRNVYATAMPVRFFESGMIDSLNHQSHLEASDLKSSIATLDMKPKIEVNCNLLEEIGKINLKLIETVVEISPEDVSETGVPIAESGEGTFVRCSYTPVSSSLNWKSELTSFLASPIMPLKLLVPINYPAYSPKILDKLPSESSIDCGDLSAKAKAKLILALQALHQPLSLGDIAKTWDTCARAVMCEFAQKLGGGSYSSTYGSWKSYPSVA